MGKLSAEKASITLGAQIGGEEAFERTNKHILELRRLLARHCTEAFSPDVDEIALILRVDGEAQKFGLRGAGRPKLRKKQRFIEIEKGVPRASWAGHSTHSFRKILVKNIEHSVELCFSELVRSGVSINTRGLLEGLGKAKSDFCSKANV